MNKLSLKLDCVIYDEIKNYLLDLNGVYSVKIEKDEITITYDVDGIDVYMLKNEIELFLEIDNIPSIIGFNKYSQNNLSKYELFINNLCCEHCLKGYIEELLMTDGIEKCSTDYDYVNKKNVKLFVEYDENVISSDEILLLENEFNESISVED